MFAGSLSPILNSRTTEHTETVSLEALHGARSCFGKAAKVFSSQYTNGADYPLECAYLGNDFDQRTHHSNT